MNMKALDMTLSNLNLADGAVLKEDLYKDNTLLLKKGIILNAYLINKLNNFGFYTQSLVNSVEDKPQKTQPELKKQTTNTEVLIYQQNIFDSNKTKKVLEYAGFSPDKISVINNSNKIPYGETNISYIFVDSVYYNDDFMEDVTLLKSNNKLIIFVLGCDSHTPKHVDFNTDSQTVKFLYRPLANDYIKALLNSYS